MVIGGIGVIARGVVRHTDDADATVWAPDLDISALFRVLGEEGIRGRIPDAEEFARQNQVLLLIHEVSGVPMELSLASLPFERDALARADHIRIDELDIPVATAQDLVVYKTVAWRDEDRLDVERLLRLHWDAIDHADVRARVAEFAEALDDRDRLIEFDVLLAKLNRERA